MTRLTDYAIMLLAEMARGPAEATHSARELSAHSRLPQPTVSKILKILARHGLLDTRRGVKGGFTLARRPDELTVADVISAFEGPIAMTQCSSHDEKCGLEPLCPVRSNWRKINRAVLEALKGITLADMTHPLDLAPPPALRSRIQVGGAVR